MPLAGDTISTDGGEETVFMLTVLGAEVALPPAPSKAFETNVWDPERPKVFHAKVYGALSLLSFSTPFT